VSASTSAPRLASARLCSISRTARRALHASFSRRALDLLTDHTDNTRTDELATYRIEVERGVLRHRRRHSVGVGGLLVLRVNCTGD
jgi:hypothetical protein